MRVLTIKRGQLRERIFVIVTTVLEKKLINQDNESVRERISENFIGNGSSWNQGGANSRSSAIIILEPKGFFQFTFLYRLVSIIPSLNMYNASVRGVETCAWSPKNWPIWSLRLRESGHMLHGLQSLGDQSFMFHGLQSLGDYSFHFQWWCSHQ